MRSRAVALEDLATLPHRPASLAARRDGEGVRWSVFAGEEALVGEASGLQALLESWGERPVIAHDWKETSRATAATLGKEAVRHAAVAPRNLEHDTAVGAYLVNPARRQYPLDELLEEAGIEAAADAEGEDGLAQEAAAVHALAALQRGEIDRLELRRLFDEVELPLVEVLCWMERIGVKVDPERIDAIARNVSSELEQLEREVWDLAGEEFTLGSPQQLSRVLFEQLGLSRKRRGKTGFSTDARVLRAIRDEHPIVSKIETWRELSKLKSTYLDALPALISKETGRLHTTFNQTATTTGRLSSTNPNLQNIPIRTPLGRQIRGCFVTEGGCRLISADYSQVELRILAHVASEQVLKDIFARGEDVHAATAAEVLKLSSGEIGPGERSKAKAVNFGIVYGLSPHGLSEQLDIPHDEAAEYIDRYLGRFPAVQAFIEQTIAKATEDGYVKTLFGRIRPIPELRSAKYQTRSQGERLAVNTVIQGTAADIMKVAMVRCHRRLSEAALETRLVLTVHDELLFEGPEAEAEQACQIVRREMESAYELDPPLEVELGVGDNWLEAK